MTMSYLELRCDREILTFLFAYVRFFLIGFKDNRVRPDSSFVECFMRSTPWTCLQIYQPKRQTIGTCRFCQFWFLIDWTSLCWSPCFGLAEDFLPSLGCCTRPTLCKLVHTFIRHCIAANTVFCGPFSDEPSPFHEVAKEKFITCFGFSLSTSLISSWTLISTSLYPTLKF